MPQIEFQPVSPKLTTVRLLSLAIGMGILLIAVACAWIFLPQWAALAGSALWVLLTAWAAVLIPRQTRALGYCERESDLVLRKGVMFREQLLVPYGRMQYVQVESGPLEQRFGLATVKLHSAAADRLTLSGLTKPEADALRDRLAAHGESHLAGL